MGRNPYETDLKINTEKLTSDFCVYTFEHCDIMCVCCIYHGTMDN